jgi:DNA invertase Pin-like site-specific DNA recombinase
MAARHTLLEFCGLLNCLILDEDGMYDLRVPKDRLLLGMKGTMSEMELSIFRQRVSEARNFKSKRGELFGTNRGRLSQDRARGPHREGARSTRAASNHVSLQKIR